MKKGDYESLLPPKEGSWTLTNLLSLQQEKKNGDERTPLQIHSMERWIAQ
jgi:hypothetical protein